MSERNMRPEEVVAAFGGENYVGATECLPDDLYPMLVVNVTKTGKTIAVKPLRSVGGDTGHSPAYYNGPFPVWNHEYTQDELKAMASNMSPRWARWSEKMGCYLLAGTPVKVGVACYRRDYSL